MGGGGGLGDRGPREDEEVGGDGVEGVNPHDVPHPQPRAPLRDAPRPPRRATPPPLPFLLMGGGGTHIAHSGKKIERRSTGQWGSGLF